MVLLKVLSGQKAGTAWVARRFPVRIGRSSAADLQLEESGVWDQHLRLDFNPTEGIVLTAQPDALATVNGQPVHQSVLRNGEATNIGAAREQIWVTQKQRTVLRNGDAINIGSSTMQFWLSEIRQTWLRLREGVTWAGIAAISFGQIGLI